MDNLKKQYSKLDIFIKNPKKSLWKMTVPFLLGLTVQSLYMLIDTMFVGKFLFREGLNAYELEQLSQSALDAMGVIFPLMFIIMGLTFGLGSGTTTLIAQFIGSKDKKSADSVASHTVLIGFILPIIIIAIVLLLGESIISLQLRQNNNIQTLDYANQYFNIMAFGSVFMIFAIFFRSILSGEGETILPMRILGMGTLINIVLDPILIIWLRLEVMGAAIATVISNGLVALTFMYLLIVKQKSYIKINLRKPIFKFDFNIIKKLFRLGIPASLSFAIMSIGMFANNSILSLADQTSSTLTSMGDGGVIGGYQTASRLENLFMIPIIAISSSLVTMVGMFYGSKKTKLIKLIIWYGLKWGLILSIISTILFVVFSKSILTIFTNDSKTILEGVKYFNICAFTYPFVTIGMITCRAMQGMDRPTPFLFLTMLRVILIAVPMAWIGVKYFEQGTVWVWWSVLASSIIAAIAGILWMLKVIKEID